MFLMDIIKSNRQFLKNHGWQYWDDLLPDQKQGTPPPNLQKPPLATEQLFDLVPVQTFKPPTLTLFEAIALRRSIREYADEPLNLFELSFLLWATQGVHEVADDFSFSLRSVPSAGARHPFETYLIVKSVSELEPGLYRYLPLDHRLCFSAPIDELRSRASDESWLLPVEAVLFVWTALPYRTEWRYDMLSHKMIAIEAGHICQNLYLAGTAVDVGTCAIGSFPQDEIDGILSVDGEDEFAVYMAGVGKIHQP